MKIIATKPVNLFWQTVFAIVIDVFAYYRIKKLRCYLKIIVLPVVVILTVISTIFTEFVCTPDWWLFIIYDTCQPLEPQIIAGMIHGAFLVFSIYLIRKWSKIWNKQFEGHYQV